MRFGAFLLVFLVPIFLFGQFTLAPRVGKSSTSNVSAVPLPFWDDFSASASTPDTTLWIYGADVFINSSLGINPPTYKLATFDGLTEFGASHAIDNGLSGPTDSLVSQPILLGTLFPMERSTVFLSFYWQGKGNGERPDDSDSLRLQFRQNDSTWVTVWKKTGADPLPDSTFTQEILAVTTPYLHDQFQFKFQSFGRQSGPFDTWHIDYIYLNKNRTAGDTLHFDRALTNAPSLAFAPYAQIPAHVFFAQPENLGTQFLSAVNLFDAPHPLDYYMTVRNLSTDETYGTSALGNAGLGALNPLELRRITGDSLAWQYIPELNPLPDSQYLEVTYYYETGDKNLFEEVDTNGDTLFLPINLKVNDTIRSTYLLHDFYSYDDGVAEYAAGLNEKDSKLAIRFVLDEPDTLTHIDIHFPEIVPSPVGKTLNLMIWTRLSPREQLRQIVPYTVVANSSRDEFKRIPLSNPFYVKDTIFIGFQQLIQEFVPIGFDRNNQVAFREIFSRTGSEWVQNDRLIGAFMIRAVFDEAPDYVMASNLPNEAQLYPNPTSGPLTLDKYYLQILVFDVAGRMVFEGAGHSIDLSSLQAGVYSLRLSTDNSVTNKKVIIVR